MGRREILIGIFVLIALLAIFLPSYRHLEELRSQRNQLETRNDELAASNEALREEIDRLENDPVYLELVARREMRLTRPGEIIYRFVEEPDEQVALDVVPIPSP